MERHAHRRLAGKGGEERKRAKVYVFLYIGLDFLKCEDPMLNGRPSQGRGKQNVVSPMKFAHSQGRFVHRPAGTS